MKPKVDHKKYYNTSKCYICVKDWLFKVTDECTIKTNEPKFALEGENGCGSCSKNDHSTHNHKGQSFYIQGSGTYQVYFVFSYSYIPFYEALPRGSLTK